MDSSLPRRAESSGGWSVYDVPALPETVCAGHFADYPALPVALLMGQLGKVVWRLLDSARGLGECQRDRPLLGRGAGPF